MASDMKRVLLSLPPDLVEKTECLKHEHYQNKSYSEMYRRLIWLGIDALEKNPEQSTITIPKLRKKKAKNFKQNT